MPRPKNPATLSAEREREIKEDYIAWQISSSPNAYLHFQNLTLDDIYIEKYLGTYNDSVALFITAKGQGYQDVVSQGTLAGFLFKFGSSQRLYIHKNSMFVDLFEAYHSGLITEHDVGDIWWYYQHEGHSYGDIN
ncbi:MAG: hypothetical protein FWE80_02375 [Oscillospiraceae bacterium]|nr:hypothetical protein [Oscillospiraceae bacterium]